jgi:cytochrome c peroxidase
MPPLQPNPTAVGEAGDVGAVACTTCHEPVHWFSDAHSEPRDLSLAIRYSFRNDPSLVNAAFYDDFGWAGSGDSLWTFITTTPESPIGGTRNGLVHLVFDHYRSDYEAIFGPMPGALADTGRFPAQARPRLGNESLNQLTQPWITAWNGMSAADQLTANTIYVNACKAIAAYLRLLVSRNAPFDRYVAGDEIAISVAAKRGLRLFIGKAGCIACHPGPFFTDHRYHATGVAQSGPNVPSNDTGRLAVLQTYSAGIPPFSAAGAFSDDAAAGMAKLEEDGLIDPTPTAADRASFRTKALRQIAETAPYMHDGLLPDLESVVEFYDQGGGTAALAKDPLMQRLGLTALEKSDLVEFLKTLTGDPIPAELTADLTAP